MIRQIVRKNIKYANMEVLKELSTISKLKVIFQRAKLILSQHHFDKDLSKVS